MLADRIQAMPGVSAAALVKPVPGLSASPIQEPVTALGVSAATDAAVVVTSPGYFDVLGISLLAGRSFDYRDGEVAPTVAVVSKSLARHLMPEGLRGELRIDVGSRPYHRGLDVIGIADDASVPNVRDVAPRVVYLSALQQPPPLARWPGLLVRMRPRAAPAAAALARTIDELGHEFVMRTASLTDSISRSLARERLLAIMAVVYGLLAIAMVAIGLWALLAQEGTRRVREFGVRLSVGASSGMLHRAVTTRAMKLTAVGTTVGSGHDVGALARLDRHDQSRLAHLVVGAGWCHRPPAGYCGVRDLGSGTSSRQDRADGRASK
jgi:putative ABC transport system permease protein